LYLPAYVGSVYSSYFLARADSKNNNLVGPLAQHIIRDEGGVRWTHRKFTYNKKMKK
ncbi:hypothetical protein HAX54_042087, partial [Datura stramonium]|nr:hypothetical protein [Datura stramonium]